MTWGPLLGLFGAGILAGAINTIAGGGSLIGLPALMAPEEQAEAQGWHGNSATVQQTR